MTSTPPLPLSANSDRTTRPRIAPPSPNRPSSPSSSALSGLAASPSRKSPGPSTPQKSRARDLLRKHYAISVPAASGKPNDPMDIDSPAFNARAYYEQLITTASLPTLIKRENELVNEIRDLDSERQSLVYNHHHELIAASDTIRAMKTMAESVDADLDKLRAAFSEISRLGAEVAVEDEGHEENRLS